MKIGCPKEIKPQEFRVGMTPSTAGEAVRHGHQVLDQQGGGLVPDLLTMITSRSVPPLLKQPKKSSPAPT